MAKIINFVYCKEIQNRQQTPNSPFETIIIGPMPQIIVPFIPSMFSFSLSFGLLWQNNDNAVQLQCRFANPNGDVINDTGIIDLTNPMQTTDEKKRGFQCNLDMRNIPLETEGTYTSEISINGNTVGVYGIEVIKHAE